MVSEWQKEWKEALGNLISLKNKKLDMEIAHYENILNKNPDEFMAEHLDEKKRIDRTKEIYEQIKKSRANEEKYNELCRNLRQELEPNREKIYILKEEKGYISESEFDYDFKNKITSEINRKISIEEDFIRETEFLRKKELYESEWFFILSAHHIAELSGEACDLKNGEFDFLFSETEDFKAMDKEIEEAEYVLKKIVREYEEQEYEVEE